MPARIIREGILTSETVNRLSQGGELFYRRLLNVVDDYGRYHALTPVLRANCYPAQLESVTEQEVASWFAECVALGLLTPYRGGKLLFVNNFGQQHRAKSKFPPPSPELPALTEADHDINLISSCSHQSKAEADSDSEAETESEPPKSLLGAEPSGQPPGPEKQQQPPPAGFGASRVGKDQEPPVHGPAARSVVPTLEEVFALGRELNYPADRCQKFFDHYSSLRGAWNRIVWQEKLRGWRDDDAAKAAPAPPKPRRKNTFEDCL